MSFAHSPKIVTDGLVLSLDAGNTKSYPGTGTTWFDKSGFSNNGTLVNGPTFNTGSLGSIVFDGVDDYATVNTNPALPGISGSVSVWFNITNTQGYTVDNAGLAEIILKHNTFGSFNGWGIYATTSSLGSYIKNGGTNYSLSVTASVITPNKWYNAVTTFQSNASLILYNNGAFAESRSVGTLTTNTDSLRLAISNDSFWAKFQGQIANVQIYNRVLTQAEITQNFNALRGRFGI